jgi:transposase-like protein
MRPSTEATPSSNSRRSSTSSTRPGTPPRRSASPTTSTRSSSTCAIPTSHRRRWRSTNLLERSLGEVKRRTKVIGRFPGEDSCLTLVWAVLDLVITNEANGIRFTQLDRQQLNRIRYQDPEPTIPKEVNAA